MGIYYFGYLISWDRVFLALSRKKEMRLLEQEKIAHVFDYGDNGLGSDAFSLYSGFFLIWIMLKKNFSVEIAPIEN